MGNTSNRKPFQFRIPTEAETKGIQERKAIRDKQKHVQQIINEAKATLATNNAEAVLAIVRKIINLYEAECPGIRGAFNSETFRTDDYSNFLEILIARLDKLQIDIPVKFNEQQNTGATFINYNSNTVTVNITISCVFEAIEKSALSADEKEELKDKLAGIESTVNSKSGKKKVWDKIKGVLGWVSSKAVDVGLAVTLVPYLAEILKGLGL